MDKKIQQDDAVFAILVQRKDFGQTLCRFYKAGGTLTPLQVQTLSAIFIDYTFREYCRVFASEVKSVYWTQEMFEVLHQALDAKEIYRFYQKAENLSGFKPCLSTGDAEYLVREKNWDLLYQFAHPDVIANMIISKYSKNAVLPILKELCPKMNEMVTDQNYPVLYPAFVKILRYVFDDKQRDVPEEKARGLEALRIIKPFMDETGAKKKFWQRADDALAWAGYVL